MRSSEGAGRRLAIGAALYGELAYAVAPSFWRHHERQPGLAEEPIVTRTSLGIAGDARGGRQ